MTKIQTVLPLFVPSFNRLKADAVWVTIANWAEGFEDKYGSAHVIAGTNKYLSNEIRAKCFSKSSGKQTEKKVSRFRKSILAKLAETFIKDLRWYYEEIKSTDIELEQFKNAPFIWQHHDLFQTKGLKIAKKLGKPSVLFVDAPYVWEAKKWGVNRLGWEWFSKKWGDAKPLNMADLVLVVSEEVKQAVIDLGVNENKILITPCTVSTKRFNVNDATELRKSLDLENEFVIGWVGSFRKFHSLNLLLDAFQQISSSISNAKLLLVGDGPERYRLAERVEELGLIKRVIFTGNVPHNEVNAYIGSFDIAILPSESYSGFHYSPLKLREFFAAGVPVVASAVGDVKNVIEQSDGGWLVPPSSKDEIANMIQKIESNRKELQAASLNAKKYAANEMGISKQIQMIEDYFGISS
ncbi:glycosyltransferase [Marivirga arenosa]|uniref:Glycosyltransferase n=1 Tax=Marivirga arenosa TaxID=3059076 RepID=A0AA51X529_9BACT|nr:glycosyltransferase [Marivirga sp. BKB1-2]WNB16864.1 glycosyltransferase [Marivirga sp. BKB1-2]